MSKSTPLSQLPNAMNSNGGDMMMDEDPTVQEVLSQFEQPLPSQHHPSQFQQQQQQPQYTAMQAAQMPPQQMFSNMQQNNPMDFVIPPQQHPIYNNTVSSGLSFDSDMKHALLVIVITCIVQIVPVETLVYKYVSIDHLPYSGFMIKALCAGALFFFAKKYV
jgi:hypothetical protein